MAILDLIKRLPVDLGQGTYRHRTKAKVTAFELVGDGNGKQALDVGCGDGYWSKRLESQGWNVTATDNYDFRNPSTKQVDLEHPLPFQDGSFDLVWMTEVLEHIKNADQLVQELRRITAPGGRIVLTTPNSAFWLYDILTLFGVTPAQVQNPDHKQFFSLYDMKRLFPTATIYGFFPYAIVKFRIRAGIGLLSPTFIVNEELPRS